MAHDDKPSNTSANRTFEDVLAKYRTRREVMVGGGTLATTAFFAPSLSSADVLGIGGGRPGNGDANAEELVGFRPVPLDRSNDTPEQQNGQEPRISPDYEYEVLIPWGTSIQPGGPEYTGDPTTRPTAEEQANQIGIGHDGMWFFPEPVAVDPRDRFGFLGGTFDDASDNNGWTIAGVAQRGSNTKGMLAINHEFGRNSHVFGKSAPETLEDVRVSQHAHGVSCVAIQNINGTWQRVASPNNRRIHVNTPVTFSGPVANSDLIKTPAGNEPLGTVNNCSNGYTPWGTYLTCEENFNGYFGWTDPDYVPTPEQARYGFDFDGFGYGWEQFDARFDLSVADFKNEENRFGWVVEIDPNDGTQVPVKRTALGRFKHEGVAIAIGVGNRVVAYMGDDQRFDYIYKFVSAGSWRRMRLAGKSPLDEGKLYVARFNDDGTGDWLELTINDPLIQQAGFTSQEEVLTYARIAADALGATKMDRPEWTTVTQGGECFVTLTNNSQRTEADAANPLAPNADGHIIRFKDARRFTGTTFTWEIYVISQETHGTEESFSDPDGIWADPDGRLFIETDGGQKDGLQDQILVSDIGKRTFKRLFEGVNSDEITGLTMTPDRRTLFINTQHPGNGNPEATNFPAPTDGVTIPRDTTIVIRRKDGGIIGS